MVELENIPDSKIHGLTATTYKSYLVLLRLLLDSSWLIVSHASEI